MYRTIILVARMSPFDKYFLKLIQFSHRSKLCTTYFGSCNLSAVGYYYNDRDYHQVLSKLIKFWGKNIIFEGESSLWEGLLHSVKSTNRCQDFESTCAYIMSQTVWRSWRWWGWWESSLSQYWAQPILHNQSSAKSHQGTASACEFMQIPQIIQKISLSKLK